MRSNRWFRALLFSTLLAAACTAGAGSALEPTNPGAPALSNSSSQNFGGNTQQNGNWGKYASCKPMTAATGSALIGPLGGTLKIGPHRLVVPAGALLVPTMLTGQVFADTINSVKFGPEGLKFLRAADLELKYDNCMSGSLPAKVIYTTEDLKTQLELEPSVDYPASKRVNASILHFSRFAVAY